MLRRTGRLCQRYVSSGQYTLILNHLMASSSVDSLSGTSAGTLCSSPCVLSANRWWSRSCFTGATIHYGPLAIVYSHDATGLVHLACSISWVAPARAQPCMSNFRSKASSSAQLPEQTTLTQVIILWGSVKCVATSKEWVTAVEECVCKMTTRLSDLTGITRAGGRWNCVIPLSTDRFHAAALNKTLWHFTLTIFCLEAAPAQATQFHTIVFCFFCSQVTLPFSTLIMYLMVASIAMRLIYHSAWAIYDFWLWEKTLVCLLFNNASILFRLLVPRIVEIKQTRHVQLDLKQTSC